MDSTTIAPEEGTTLPESSANDGQQAEERPAMQSVPLHKHMEVKKSLEQKLGETEAQYKARIEQLESDLTKYKQLAGDDETKALAEETGLDLPVLNRLLEVAEKRAEKKFAPISEIQKELEAQKMLAHRQKAEAEFGETVAPLIINDLPNASPAIIAGIRSKIMELAFQAPYNAYKLAHIYQVAKDQLLPRTRQTAETSGGMETTTGEDFSNVTEEDVKSMNWRTFERYENWKRKQKR